LRKIQNNFLYQITKMPTLYLNNIKVNNMITSKNKYYTKYSINNITDEHQIFELQNNKIVIKDDNEETIYEYEMNPISENFENILKNLNEGEFQFNIDMYEDLVPLKYSITKKNNQLLLHSLEHTIF